MALPLSTTSESATVVGGEQHGGSAWNIHTVRREKRLKSPLGNFHQLTMFMCPTEAQQKLTKGSGREASKKRKQDCDQLSDSGTQHTHTPFSNNHFE